MDRLLREQIVAEVSRNVREAYEIYNEKWVTGKTLGEYVETMTAAWLKSYGNRVKKFVITSKPTNTRKKRKTT